MEWEERQAEAERVIASRREGKPDPRIGQRVKKGDAFPAGSEFICHDMNYLSVPNPVHMILKWKDGKSGLWVVEQNWFFAATQEPLLPDPDPNNIKEPFRRFDINLIVTKIGSGTEPERREKMEVRKMTQDEIQGHIEAHLFFRGYRRVEGENVNYFNSYMYTHYSKHGIASLKPGITYFVVTSEKGCKNYKGNLCYGGALREDGFAEFGYFVGGECPWVIHNPGTQVRKFSCGTILVNDRGERTILAQTLGGVYNLIDMDDGNRWFDGWEYHGPSPVEVPDEAILQSVYNWQPVYG